MTVSQAPEVEAIWKAVYGEDAPTYVMCSLGHEYTLDELQPITVEQDEHCYQDLDGPDPVYWGLQCPECQGRALYTIPLPGNL
jgi:hypothetical protein